jgi:hypothetical protein
MSNVQQRRDSEDQRLRANVLAATLVGVLLALAAWVGDELWEASFTCYAPEDSCAATGVPAPPALNR